jgi:hypothetical protein
MVAGVRWLGRGGRRGLRWVGDGGCRGVRGRVVADSR